MDLTALFSQAVGFHQSGKLDEAGRVYGQILSLEPGNFAARQLLALIRFQQGANLEALNEIAAALAIKPDSPEALATRGNILIKLDQLEESLESFDRAIALKPDYAEALYNRGNCRQYLNRYEEAAADYSSALALNPGYEPALTNRGNALSKLRRFSEALADYEKAEQLRPGDPVALYHRANALKDLQRFAEALACYDIALAGDAEFAMAWNNRGSVLRELGRPEEALASFDRALMLAPDDVAALFNRATLQWTSFERREAALRDLEKVIALDSGYPYARGDLLHLRMYGGDWRDFETQKTLIDQGVGAGKEVVEPFVYQAISESPQDLEACAKIYAAHYPAGPAPWRKARLRRRKIRVGYVSGEFRAQATQYLAAGLYERHDREEFEIVAFDNGQSDGSPMRERLEAAFDRLIDISRLTDREAAELIQSEEIDIAVNLNGYFGKQRMGVFALRPAPVQVNYLGFPGTLGAPYIDYILADRIVIPDEDRRYYSEQVVWLPDCYQVNDDKRAPAGPPPSRASEGLPDRGFVFCNFNQSYKLTPRMVGSWMRLLKEVEGSVLWLTESNTAFPFHLRQEAERQGVAGSRLVFARAKPLDQHLTRLSLADLFLDSLPYNAHTTASDALWAGVPLLTCLGRAFAGRVAASLLTAIGLPELIAADLEGYEALALKLAHSPSLLHSFRNRLAQNRATHSLFHTDRFRRHIEAAYRQMWEIAQRGEAPRHFAVG